MISGVCERALKEEGKLDVFFANVRMFAFCATCSYSTTMKAGIASKDPLESTTAEVFMNVMRVNSLSYVYLVPPTDKTLTGCRCFLAVKFASAAMKKANESRGKNSSGGSIILTASGLLFLLLRRKVIQPPSLQLPGCAPEPELSIVSLTSCCPNLN